MGIGRQKVSPQNQYLCNILSENFSLLQITPAVLTQLCTIIDNT